MSDQNCIRGVIESLEKGDDDFANYLGSVFHSELAAADKLNPPKTEHHELLKLFIDAMKNNPDNMMDELKEKLKFNEKNDASRTKIAHFDKSLKSVCDKFFAALKSRCQDRDRFKSWFNKPDLFERGIGMIIFSIIFLYGWLGEETSTAFADAMRNAQETNAEMSLLELVLANYLQMGSIQIMTAMVFTIAKSWILLVALVAAFYFVETFIVEAALNPVNLTSAVVNELAGKKCMEVNYPILPSLSTNPMKSIRVATFFILDRRVVFAIILAFVFSILFASCCSLYLAMSKGTPEDARYVGKMVCAFQLLLMFTFVLFVVVRSDA